MESTRANGTVLPAAQPAARCLPPEKEGDCGRVATARSVDCCLMTRSQLPKAPPNKRMQLTKAARCAPFAFRSWGQSLKAAFAADPQCCAGLHGLRRSTFEG